MGCQRSLGGSRSGRGRRLLDIGSAAGIGRNRRDTDRSTPVIERIEDISLAELDPHWTPPWALPVVALEIAIDAGLSDTQGNPLPRPAHHLLERRTDDANQMTVVLA